MGRDISFSPDSILSGEGDTLPTPYHLDAFDLDASGISMMPSQTFNSKSASGVDCRDRYLNDQS